MLKKTRKIMSFILALSMLWMTAVPVFAVDINSKTSSENKLTNASNNVLYSVLGKDAPAEFCASLEAHGITINADTVIEVQEMSVNRTSTSTYSARSGQPETTEVSGTGLVITNEEGNLITKTMVMNFVEDSETQALTVSNNITANNQYIDPFGDGTVVILMSAQYYKFIDQETLQAYFQPRTALMMYMDTSGVHDVEYVEMNYDCVGYLYDSNTFEPIETEYEWDPYIHCTQVIAENPEHQDIYQEDALYSPQIVFLVTNPLTTRHGVGWKVVGDEELFIGNWGIIDQ